MAAKIGKPQPSINTGRRKKTTMRWRLKEKGTNNNKKGEKKPEKQTNKRTAPDHARKQSPARRLPAPSQPQLKSDSLETKLHYPPTKNKKETI